MRRLLVLFLLLLAAVAATWLAWPVADEDASVLRRNGDAGAHAVRHEATDESAPRPVVLRGAPPAETPLARDEGGLYGVVLGAKTGAPVAGVTVHALTLDWYHGEFAILASGVSDARGRYRLRGLASSWQDTGVLALGGGWITDLDWQAALADDDEHPRAIRFEVVPGAWVAFDVHVRPAARVEGVVSLPGGAPALGATVGLARSQDVGGFPWRVLPPVPTDEAGRYVIDAVPKEEGLGIVASLDGHVDVMADVSGLAGDARRVLDLAFPPKHRARIRVVDRVSGAPIEDAEVRFLLMPVGVEDAAEQRVGVRTDAEGLAVLAPVPPGGCRVKVEREGYLAFGWCEGDRWGSILEETDAGLWTGTAALIPMRVLAGRVAWPPGTSTPSVAHVRSAGATQHLNTEFRGFAEVSADGTFRLELPPDGTHRLTLHAFGDGRLWTGKSEVEEGSTIAVIEPVLRPGRADEPVDYSLWRRWRLALRDPQGRPVASTVVEREGPAACEVLTSNPAVRLEDGVLEIMVEPGNDPVWLSLWFARTVDDEPLGRYLAGPFGPEGGEREVVFPVAQTIAGRVLAPDGLPVQGIEVLATPRAPLHDYFSRDDAALTDADGRFVLRLLLQDRYEVSVEPADTWILPPAQRAAAGATGLVFRLGASETRTITVRDARGEPVDRAFVILWQQDGVRGPDADYDGIHVWTGADGTVAVEGLEAGGSYTLRVEPPKERHDLLLWRDREWTPRDESVVLPPALTVAGRVLDASDRAMARVEVWLEHPGGRTEVVRTNSAGRFRFRRVAVGDVRLGACFLKAHADGWTPDFSVTAQAGDDDVVLFLDSARDLDVLVEFPQDERHAFQTIDLTDLDGGTPAVRTRVALPADGVVRVRGLVPGHRYRLWGGPVEGGRYVLAEIGARQTIAHVPIEDGMVIEGRLLLPRGAQKSGVKLVLRGVHCHAAPLRDGTFRLMGVPPGEWTLEAWCHVEGERRAVRRAARGGDTPTFDLTSP